MFNPDDAWWIRGENSEEEKWNPEVISSGTEEMKCLVA